MDNRVLTWNRPAPARRRASSNFPFPLPKERVNCQISNQKLGRGPKRRTTGPRDYKTTGPLDHGATRPLATGRLTDKAILFAAGIVVALHPLPFSWTYRPLVLHQGSLKPAIPSTLRGSCGQWSCGLVVFPFRGPWSLLALGKHPTQRSFHFPLTILTPHA